MASEKTTEQVTRQTHRSDAEALQDAQAEQAGSQFEWHYGRVTRVGHFGDHVGREVTIIWEEGGVTSQQGTISDAQWEIFKLAFLSTKRIAILSDAEGDGWMYDYRYLEAVG